MYAQASLEIRNRAKELGADFKPHYMVVPGVPYSENYIAVWKNDIEPS